jgi:hypothetical protein
LRRWHHTPGRGTGGTHRALPDNTTRPEGQGPDLLALRRCVVVSVAARAAAAAAAAAAVIDGDGLLLRAAAGQTVQFSGSVGTDGRGFD